MRLLRAFELLAGRAVRDESPQTSFFLPWPLLLPWRCACCARVLWTLVWAVRRVVNGGAACLALVAHET